MVSALLPHPELPETFCIFSVRCFFGLPLAILQVWVPAKLLSLAACAVSNCRLKNYLSLKAWFSRSNSWTLESYRGCSSSWISPNLLAALLLCLGVTVISFLSPSCTDRRQFENTWKFKKEFLQFSENHIFKKSALYNMFLKPYPYVHSV